MKTGVEMAYLLAAILFIVGLKLLGRPQFARRGNALSAAGMLLALGVTLLDRSILDYRGIIAGLVLGGTIGSLLAARVAMTAMPEMVALLNGFGGLASLLVGWLEQRQHPVMGAGTAAAIALSVLVGGATFSGSVLAWGKLNARFGSRPLMFPGQQWLNAGLLLAALAAGAAFAVQPAAGPQWLPALIILSLALGMLAVLPIGGADMPVVISLLNSYSGLAACATGFVLGNTVLIVTGALVGSSGIILTRIMCQAMNRPLANVLFSGFGAPPRNACSLAAQGELRSVSADEAALLLEAARQIVIIPGYGLAVAQAQHVARELGDLLARRGAEVRYVIHPVAGRMPGHMNVLLAEADVPYDQLVEMSAANPTMGTVDVCLVVGANDVVNPAAREDSTSPLFGMPVIDADRARTVIILKRSLAPGFAGIENPLFLKPNARMLFGDAKSSLQKLVTALKEFGA